MCVVKAVALLSKVEPGLASVEDILNIALANSLLLQIVSGSTTRKTQDTHSMRSGTTLIVVHKFHRKAPLLDHFAEAHLRVVLHIPKLLVPAPLA